MISYVQGNALQYNFYIELFKGFCTGRCQCGNNKVDRKEKAVDEMEIISAIENKPVGLIVSCQGPEENNTELIKLLVDKFCESSLVKCIGKYIFLFCGPDISQSVYDFKTVRKIFQDVHKSALVEDFRLV